MSITLILRHSFHHVWLTRLLAGRLGHPHYYKIGSSKKQLHQFSYNPTLGIRLGVFNGSDYPASATSGVASFGAIHFNVVFNKIASRVLEGVKSTTRVFFA
jgi:hypothetical protein